MVEVLEWLFHLVGGLFDLATAAPVLDAVDITSVGLDVAANVAEGLTEPRRREPRDPYGLWS